MSSGVVRENRLHSLDVLRGVAVLGVVGFHCACYGPSGIAALDTLFDFGKLGVQLFFLISAMTMCHMWDQRAGETRRTAKFYIRRCMRIAPLFWLAIPVYLAANGLSHGTTWLDVTLTALFLHGFWPSSINNVVPGGWSIAVEMTFYALFPMLISTFGPRRRLYLGSAAMLIVAYQFIVRGWLGTLVTADSFGAQKASEFLFFNFLNQAPVFLIGCYLHFAWRAEQLDKAELLGIAAFTAFTCTFDQTFPLICIWLSAAVWLILRAAPKNTLLERFGQNSYAIYLTHFLVLQAYAGLVPAHTGAAQLLFHFGVVAAICYTLARLIHFGIDRPVIRLTKHLIKRMDRMRQPYPGSNRLASP